MAIETKFIVVKEIGCSICKGIGEIHHPDGDIERCTLCGGRGGWQSEVSFEEAASELGYVRPVAQQPVNREAASSLERAYYHFYNAPGDLPCASALIAIAEQLALLNETLCKMDR